MQTHIGEDAWVCVNARYTDKYYTLTFQFFKGLIFECAMTPSSKKSRKNPDRVRVCECV